MQSAHPVVAPVDALLFETVGVYYHMKQLFTYLFSWILAIVVLVAISDGLVKRERESEQIRRNVELPASSDLESEYRRARSAFGQKDYVLALKILDDAEAGLSDRTVVSDRFRLSFYHLKGATHWSLWQYVNAEQSWLMAADSAVSVKDKKRIQELLRGTQRILDQVNDERNKRHVYLASPEVGPSARLSGKVALIYVFIRDSASGSWSLRNRTHAMRTWQSAQAWMTKAARGYGENLEFSKRLFVINKHPGIKRLNVGDVSQNFKHANRMVNFVAEHFGYNNILSFTEAIKREEQADEAILMFHLAKDGRSFASRCMTHCGKQGEFVFLLESTKTKHWQSLEYAQAHESLHLFGADDLYNISNARNYAVTDIMNYPSRILRGSTLEDITAFGVGLKRRPPRTPFKIKKY